MALENQNTYDYVRQQFAQFGLESLFGQLESIWQEGFTQQDTAVILSRLSQTNEYKQRFSANDKRKQQGLAELTPGEYVQLENQYRDLTKTAGLARYFTGDDFTKWIENDVSPMEAQQRVATAKKAAEQVDPAYKQAMTDMYGVDSDGLAAYFLNPERTTAVLEAQHNAAVIKGTASNFKVNLDAGTAELLAGQGVGGQEAQQGFGRVSDQRDAAGRLGALYNSDITQDDLVKEQFGMAGGTDVTAKKKKLASQERAAFSGSSGIAQGSLSQKKQAI